MIIIEVVNRLKELRVADPLSSSGKSEIEALYNQVTGKTFVKTSCSDCYRDACIESILYLNKYGKMKDKSNYTLKNGVLLEPEFGGPMYTNANITDEVAEKYLSANPKGIMYFSGYPADYEDRIKERLNPTQNFNEELISALVETITEGATNDAIKEAYKEYQIDGKKVTSRVLQSHITAARKIVAEAKEKE